MIFTPDTMPTITAAANNELEIELGVEEIKLLTRSKPYPIHEITVASDTYWHF